MDSVVAGQTQAKVMGDAKGFQRRACCPHYPHKLIDFRSSVSLLYTIRALVALWLLAFYGLIGDIEGFDRWRRWLDGQLKD